MAREGTGRSTARTTLIEHAERLFAEQGIEAVSLRDVSRAAGQRNHSAAQYHFGDRAGLVAAVYDARMRVVNERRAALLDELAANGRLDEVAGPVEALVRPLVEVITTTDSWYGRFLARARWDTFAAAVVADLPVVAPYRSAYRLLMQALRAQQPMPAEVRRSRADQLLTLTVGTLAGWEWARHDGARRLSNAALNDELLTTCVALVSAPHRPSADTAPPPSDIAPDDTASSADPDTVLSTSN